MKSHILPAIRLTFSCLVLFTVVYTLFVYALAPFAPNRGKGEVITANGRTVGYALIGQHFSDDRYFWSRPSAVGYNAAGSAGSNKCPSNPDYLASVQARLDTFLAHHPGVRAEEAPSELVTASGSGLDPHLSPAAVRVQAARVARARGLDVATVNRYIDEHVEGPLWKTFGPSTVNVLQLNLALDSAEVSSPATGRR